MAVLPLLDVDFVLQSRLLEGRVEVRALGRVVVGRQNLGLAVHRVQEGRALDAGLVVRGVDQFVRVARDRRADHFLRVNRLENRASQLRRRQVSLLGFFEGHLLQVDQFVDFRKHLGLLDRVERGLVFEGKVGVEAHRLVPPERVRVVLQPERLQHHHRVIGLGVGRQIGDVVLVVLEAEDGRLVVLLRNVIRREIVGRVLVKGVGVRVLALVVPPRQRVLVRDVVLIILDGHHGREVPAGDPLPVALGLAQQVIVHFALGALDQLQLPTPGVRLFVPVQIVERPHVEVLDPLDGGQPHQFGNQVSVGVRQAVQLVVVAQCRVAEARPQELAAAFEVAVVVVVFRVVVELRGGFDGVALVEGLLFRKHHLRLVLVVLRFAFGLGSGAAGYKSGGWGGKREGRRVSERSVFRSKF